MKSILIYILALIFINISCQSRVDKSFTTLDFITLHENKDEAFFNDFFNSHKLSMWVSHMCTQIVNDTFYFVSVSTHADTLFIYNYLSHQVKTIELNKTPPCFIDFIYYHNHDSIFIFYEREENIDYLHNKFDFILINAKGEILNRYSLDSVPYIYNGSYNYLIEPAHDLIEESRIINGNLIITFSIFSPGIEDKDFMNFNPKMMCSYNLSNKTVKMLNVRFPEQDIGKRYNKNSGGYTFLFSYDIDRNVILTFTHTMLLYRYDFALDSLFLIDCKYDYTFENTDSNARVKGHEYIDSYFAEPRWISDENCYVRLIVIKNYKGGKSRFVLQVLDSNFNHKAYVIPNKKQETPRFFNNQLQSKNKINQLSYHIKLGNKLKKITWEDFENNYLISKSSNIEKSLSMEKYLKKYNIPKNSLVVIFNLNYPCGNCLNYMMSEMKKNQTLYEKSNIYYILYNNNNDNLSELLLRNHDLSDCKLVKKDNGLLESVFKKSELDYHYRIIEFGNSISVEKCTFEELVPLFNKKVEDRLNNQKQ